jgi:hypothetical protein
MNKNVSGQKVTLLVIDIATNAPKTGDAANLTAYLSQNDGAVTALTDTSATEKDATNAPGLYDFDVSQAESNADKLVFSGKSSTANVRVVPLIIYTRPASFSAFVTPTGAAVGSVGTGGITRATFAADTGLQSIRSNTAQAGAGSAVTLDTGASSVDDFYNSTALLLTGGTGAGQVRTIIDYVGSTRVATVDEPWATNPDNTSTFAIFPSAATASDIAAAVLAAAAVDPIAANMKERNDVALVNGEVVDDAANSASTFKTNRTESTDDHWARCWLRFTSGALAGQTSRVISYTGSTKFVTTQAFTSEPAAGDTFELVNG